MKEYAVITGASSGLGKEFACGFARRGISSILVARSEERLNELSGELRSHYSTDSAVLPLDLTDPTSRRTLVEFCTTNSFKIGYLVNSAGYGSFGLFPKLDLKHEIQMTELNSVALQELCYSFAKMFLKNKKGTIINIASTAAFQPIPYMATYAATKAFVLSFSLALRKELHDTGVNVIAVCPGPVDTNFFDNAGMKGPRRILKVHLAAFVVERVFKAIDSRKSFVIPGFMNKVLYFLGILAPISFRAWIASKLFRPKDTSMTES